MVDRFLMPRATNGVAGGGSFDRASFAIDMFAFVVSIQVRVCGAHTLRG
jgi:hypothetical protein